MTKPKLTPFFPPSVKPVRVGVYELGGESASGTRKAFAFWNGQRFGWRCWGYDEDRQMAIDYAYVFRGSETFLPAMEPWRGLAEEPKQ